MKKIGILTFHRALNYGAALQSYALQTAIEQSKTGKQDVCEVIDYRNQVLEDGCKAYIKMSQEKNIKHVIAALLNMPIRYIRKKQFRAFTNKYLKQSKAIAHGDVEAIAKQYDAVVVGSDQVWNDELTGYDTTFLLEGYRKKKGKFSYAASFGFSHIPEDKVDTYKTCLADFRQISVREESGKQIVEEVVGRKDVMVHVDPTLLLEQKDWEKICVPVKDAGKYILIYSINPHKYLIDFAKDCARQKNLPVYFVTSNMLDAKNYKEFHMIYTPSVEKFISYIKYADTVITNSFHGTVFATIFQKPFYVEVDYGCKYNYRIESLVNTLSLRDRIITGQQFQVEREIEWDKTEALKKIYRQQSKQYLLQLWSEMES